MSLRESFGHLFCSLNEMLKKSSKGDKIENIPKKTDPFEAKMEFFNNQMKKKRVRQKETIKVNRTNIVEESMKQFQKINLYKCLRIEFEGEVNIDLGGITREWLTVLFQKLTEPKAELFDKADTDEFSYQVKNLTWLNEQGFNKYFFIGQVLGKALMDSFTVNCSFNKFIYKIILEEEIKLKDFVFIDQELYRSFKQLLEMGDEIELLELFFTVDIDSKDGKLISEKLVPFGDMIRVSKENVSEYINKRINFFVECYGIAVSAIKSGIESLIDEKLLKIFTSDELILMIEGTPFIDIFDWRESCSYRGYEDIDETIINFWEVLDDLPQEKLKIFLQFATGSKKVPIGGFKRLVTYDDKKSAFLIKKVDYIPNQINYIRAHTCFNTIDLPCYPNKELVKEAIFFILNNEVMSFGMS